jgi:hypothetical protein
MERFRSRSVEELRAWMGVRSVEEVRSMEG